MGWRGDVGGKVVWPAGILRVLRGQSSLEETGKHEHEVASCFPSFFALNRSWLTRMNGLVEHLVVRRRDVNTTVAWN